MLLYMYTYIHDTRNGVCVCTEHATYTHIRNIHARHLYSLHTYRKKKMHRYKLDRANTFFSFLRKFEINRGNFSLGRKIYRIEIGLIRFILRDPRKKDYVSAWKDR